ncbi:MAG TPA: alpha-1,4-glucan--maltose-1-phosphate maltosyltransferase [Longimicrobiales bacterium]|nr:alpha-1,4-glucan--maltose-1-phosphate maltosyltransferase [Longimicrobiales bacterium]
MAATSAGGPSGEGRRRVVIEGIDPEIDCGEFPIKRTVGERVVVEADIFTDGHDEISCALLWRAEDDGAWCRAPLTALVNDRWRGEFVVTRLGRWRYTLEGWVDHFKTWRRDLEKRIDAGQDVETELLVGAEIVDAAAARASGEAARRLGAYARRLRGPGDQLDRAGHALEDELARLTAAHPDLRYATRYERELGIVVDPERARFSAWYEVFPRSTSADPARHGTFADLERRLPYIADMGFDVLYLPPVHPVGRTHRKGKNNALVAEPEDVGSPWAIGAQDGGHKSILPELGTLADFRRLVAAAADQGLDVALDIAFQASPDHPYVREHPAWFRHLPDGAIRYAENPPKKYQDIYPFDFESEDWAWLWRELKSIFDFWYDQGVRVFRVDNPHTKSFPFWAWAVPALKAEHPDLILLSEAFTRPKVMYRLAKLGFSQSYTYFAWRNAKREIEEYFTELTRTKVREFFRPNLWPNTPDILTEALQHGGRPTFISRFILAATLGASYGIYGPAFELMEHRPREAGSEEYLHSEKYEIRQWNLARPDSLAPLIARINRIRRENPALQSDRSLRFHRVDNDRLVCYTKHSIGGQPFEAVGEEAAAAFARRNGFGGAELGGGLAGPGDGESNLILVVVNLDREYTHSGWVDLPLQELGIDPSRPYQLEDLLADARYTWHGHWNYVELNPHLMPAHIFRVTQP